MIVTVRHAFLPTSYGDLLAVAAADDTGDQDALIGLYFPQHWYPPGADAIGDLVDPAGDALFTRTAAELAAYFAGELTAFTLPVRTTGDPLSERVWTRLCEIPYGQTTTYGAIATELGNRNLAQRVGQAVGHNPISIVIPCHRVVGADGGLTGYAGGLDRKRRLLDLESPAPDEAGRLF
ncbi:MAG: methylated-DNA--[protein]-cysteine S-methyltransferase [Phycicoccus sp.]|nr:methylated-DNA--[protein]-cysteine S-methyltransferase [Phycicoccus sp.]